MVRSQEDSGSSSSPTAATVSDNGSKAAVPLFSFGKPSSSSSQPFTFGKSVQDSTASTGSAVPLFSFGQTATSGVGSSSSNGGSSDQVEEKKETAATPSFSFGKPSFSFASSEPAAKKATPMFSFNNSGSATSTDSASKPAMFSFGPTAGTGFSFASTTSSAAAGSTSTAAAADSDPECPDCGMSLEDVDHSECNTGSNTVSNEESEPVPDEVETCFM